MFSFLSQTEVFELGQDIKDLEAILTNLPEEDVDSQLAITRVSLESLEALEAGASDLEGQLNDAEKTKALASLDLLSLRTKVTSVRTTIVTLRTEAEKLRSTLEGYVGERRLRGEEIARLRGVMREIQVWLNGAKAKTATEIKLYSLGDVQRAIDVIEVRIFQRFQVSNIIFTSLRFM